MFFFSSRRRHTRYIGDWSSDVCSSDLTPIVSNGAEATDRPVSWTSTNGKVVSIQANGVDAVITAIGSGAASVQRSEERRVGKEGRSRWGPCRYIKDMSIGEE